ncbi:MAG: hypothetical protein LBG61_01490 [Burkholderiales bacterium]|jgi:hypothetical protein|nr:hypothetical protein [Burkholderiales bacterium]
MAFDLSRLNGLAARLFGTVAWVVLASTLAYWFWQIVAPSPVAVVPEFSGDAVMTLRASSLFGEEGVGKKPDTAAATSFFDWRLLGIISDQKGQGYAVFRAKNQVAVLNTGETANGVTLTRLAANEATLRDDHGAERTFLLRENNKTPEGVQVPDKAPSSDQADKPNRAARSVGRAAGMSERVGESTRRSGAVTAAKNACVPNDFKGRVVKLNPELLQGALNDPSVFYAPLEKTQDGILVKVANGHTAMLGLSRGDLLKTANDITLINVEDISGLIIRPFAGGQTVKLSGVRQGKTMELMLVNAATCP